MSQSRSKKPTLEELTDQVEALSGQVKKKTDAELLQEAILGELERLGAKRVGEDAIAREGTRMVLPATMAPQDAVTFLNNYIEQQETRTRFSRKFRYRPDDGAAALERALKRVFGSAGIGKATWTFFGKEPPERRTINIGVKETLQVPAGQVNVPSFEGTMILHYQNSRELGPLFLLIVEAPRKYEAHIEGLFDVIEEELNTHSIYKGQAVDGQAEPEFLDLTGVNPAEVIYADDAILQLQANLWSVLEHTAVLRQMNIPRKRAVLLEGPYGTGKTLAAFLTAQVATNHGWTFLYCRPARDNLQQVMGMARLYQPCIVFFEDVDVIAKGTDDRDGITRLLDMFDGIQAKGTEIVAVLTTNHKERIHKAMVRPGRLDAVIHIGALDRNGVERMVKAIVPTAILGELDYDRVYASMEGYLPAFVKEAIDRTMRYAIARDGGVPDILETDDFVLAAQGLRPQLELMEGAQEGVEADSLATAIRSEVSTAVKTTLHGSEIHDLDDDHVLTLATNGQG